MKHNTSLSSIMREGKQTDLQSKIINANASSPIYLVQICLLKDISVSTLCAINLQIITILHKKQEPKKRHLLLKVRFMCLWLVIGFIIYSARGPSPTSRGEH